MGDVWTDESGEPYIKIESGCEKEESGDEGEYAQSEDSIGYEEEDGDMKEQYAFMCSEGIQTDGSVWNGVGCEEAAGSLEDNGWMGNVCGMDESSRCVAMKGGSEMNEDPLCLDGWYAMGRDPAGWRRACLWQSQMMWFREMGIPKGSWVGDTHSLQNSCGIGDADAGTYLWVICMGSVYLPEKKPKSKTTSTLAHLFESPLFALSLLETIIGFVCPQRRPMTEALRTCRDTVRGAPKALETPHWSRYFERSPPLRVRSLNPFWCA
jgi:hypothetical protein